MEYSLKHFDTTLLKFTAKADSADPEYAITWLDEENKHLLPLDFTLSPEGIDRWIRHRTIPKNRAFVHDFLAKCGLNPFVTENGEVMFEEAKITVVGRKLYRSEIVPEGFSAVGNGETDSANYPKKDYHIVFCYEITDVRISEN